MPRSRVARIATALVVVAALVAIGAQAVHKQLRDGNDFPLYLTAARELLAGRSPYDVTSGLHGYVYLPWFAWLLTPLAALPLPVAAWIAYLSNLMFLALALGALVETVRRVAGPVRTRTLVLAALPLAGLVHDNLVLGQANVFLLLLVAATAQGAVSSTPGLRPGLPLGLAAALKMPAGLLLAPLVLRKRWLGLAGFALAAALALGAPLLVSGPERGVAMLRDWHQKVVVPAEGGWLQGSRTIDQSPQAAYRRFAIQEGVMYFFTPDLRPMYRLISLAFLAFYGFVWLRAPHRNEPRALLADLSLAACGIVQVAGFNLKAQFIVLLLPAFTAAAFVFPASGAPLGGRGVRALLALAVVLFLVSQPGLVGRTASEWMLQRSSMMWGTLALMFALARLRFRLPAGA